MKKRLGGGDTASVRRIRQPANERSRRIGISPAALAVAFCLLWLLAACSGASSHDGASNTSPAPSSTAASTSQPVWLLTRAALAQLVGDPSVRAKLGRTRVYEILKPGQLPLRGIAASPVVTFSSAAELEQVVAGGQIAPGTYGVLYDPEAWPFTPAAEQRAPVAAATQAATVAHAHDLRLIVAPGLDLTKVLDPGSPKPLWRRYVDLHLAAQLASVADVVELQSQSLERSPSTFAAFVQAARSQIKAAHRGTLVLAGLSTNPPGTPVTDSDLTSAARAVQPMVYGFWLNIPGQGPRCPSCNTPRPDIAVTVVLAI